MCFRAVNAASQDLGAREHSLRPAIVDRAPRTPIMLGQHTQPATDAALRHIGRVARDMHVVSVSGVQPAMEDPMKSSTLGRMTPWSPRWTASWLAVLKRQHEQRMALVYETTRQIVLSGKCPLCGGGLRRNNALAGWWQCEQFGAEKFRKDASRPSCNWQGFTK